MATANLLCRSSKRGIDLQVTEVGRFCPVSTTFSLVSMQIAISRIVVFINISILDAAFCLCTSISFVSPRQNNASTSNTHTDTELRISKASISNPGTIQLILRYSLSLSLSRLFYKPGNGVHSHCSVTTFLILPVPRQHKCFNPNTPRHHITFPCPSLLQHVYVDIFQNILNYIISPDRTYHHTHVVAGLIPKTLQLQAQGTSESLG